MHLSSKPNEIQFLTYTALNGKAVMQGRLPITTRVSFVLMHEVQYTANQMHLSSKSNEIQVSTYTVLNGRLSRFGTHRL